MTYDNRISKNLAMYSAIPKELIKAPHYEEIIVDGKPVSRLVE